METLIGCGAKRFRKARYIATLGAALMVAGCTQEEATDRLRTDLHPDQLGIIHARFPWGFITFLGGAFGLLMLLFEEVSKPERVQFRYYAMAVGLMAGGLAMIGIGQGLRLLLLILAKA